MIEHKVEAVKNIGERCITSNVVQIILERYGKLGYSLVSTSVLTDKDGVEILYMFFTRNVQ